jgi:hypothetical protein
MSEDRCPWCGTVVTAGSLLGNTLANGAAPKLAASAIRLYTDELGALRKRVAELEPCREVLLRILAGERFDGDALREMLGNSAGNSSGGSHGTDG